MSPERRIARSVGLASPPTQRGSNRVTAGVSAPRRCCRSAPAASQAGFPECGLLTLQGDSGKGCHPETVFFADQILGESRLSPLLSLVLPP